MSYESFNSFTREACFDSLGCMPCLTLNTIPPITTDFQSCSTAKRVFTAVERCICADLSIGCFLHVRSGAASSVPVEKPNFEHGVSYPPTNTVHRERTLANIIPGTSLYRELARLKGQPWDSYWLVSPTRREMGHVQPDD